LRLVPGIGMVDLSRPELTGRLAEIAAAQLETFQSTVRDGLLAASVQIGLGVMRELMTAEVDEVVGPKGVHQPARRAVRHGTETGSVPVGGRRVTVERPRARAVDGTGEVRLETWDCFQQVDLLSERAVTAMLGGVSTRGYATVALEDIGDVASGSTSKSAVSRRFVTATAARLAELRERDLSGRQWLVVYIDGFDLAGQAMVAGLGVDAEGNKVCIGLVQGTTENATVCAELLSGAVERGLSPSEGLLFVLDGGKGLHAAVRRVFDGQPYVIARCRQHKERNVLDYLPLAERAWTRRKLRAAWANPDWREAQAALNQLARHLDSRYPDAAASLREGLAETVTINRLGITGTLAKTVATTNPIESTIDIIMAHARNVKNWAPPTGPNPHRPAADMRLRWAAAGILCAETQYRRVKGYRQLPQLAATLALQAAITNQPAKTA
jgi:transposase-like protein